MSRQDELPATVEPPGRRHRWRSSFARWLLARCGWRVRFNGLPGPKGIVIVYPHTSNWDFVVGMLAIGALDLPLRWIGKESLFRGLAGATVGRVMQRWGGRPVDRFHASGAVAQLAALMSAEPWCWLALSPEGTRTRTERWRSGFYHLARELDVPVGLGYFDYGTREVGVTEFVRMCGNVDHDLKRMRAAYVRRRGCRPENASTIGFED